ncbi:hypothetical protein FISHEDRAFT_13114, partial [Fistulina hepatica ATCC 64428]
YLVRHGSALAKDYMSADDSTNYWEKAFPLLFPYGMGGLEAPRPTHVSLAEHARWALRYHDRRFRSQSTFMAVAFGIIQRRQALYSSKLQVNKTSFKKLNIHALSDEMLKAASEEEGRTKRAPADPTVRAWRRQVQAMASRVIATDANCAQLRSKIWSTTIVAGPPSLWITINPNDINDPIAQVLLGENIDLHSFDARCGPSPDKRAKNLATDPYGAAQYFHFILHLLMETLFGVS